jgi:Septum formation
VNRGLTAARRRLPALVGVLTVLALAACTEDGGGGEDSATSSPQSSSATPSTPPEPPRAGECRRLTLDEATVATSDAAPVACNRRHTAVTVHVGRLSRLLPGGADAVDVEGERVQRRVAEDCRPRLGAFLGGDEETRTLSRFQVVWFTPTPEEHEAGADWFRCDLLALDQDDRLLSLPPPAGLEGVLDRPESLATYGLCGTAAPGERGFERVACARRHRWVAIGTIPLEGGARYPGVAAVREAGDEPCADRVREERGFPVEFEYGWEWPTAAQWEAGQRHGFCWAPA